MAQIFHRGTNSLARVTIVGLGLGVGGALFGLGLFVRSPYITRQGEIKEQPVPFSHAHHVGGLGLDCRYCHYGVEKTAHAGVPSPSVCMNCHSQIWKEAPMLEPVRQAFKKDTTIEWVRVHDLPDFVYFNHSIHINKGVGCASCHGRVDKMALMWQESPLTMEWCLKCHRNPMPNLRPKSEVFNMAWHPPVDPEFGNKLARDYKVKSRVDCSSCHR